MRSQHQMFVKSAQQFRRRITHFDQKFLHKTVAVTEKQYTFGCPDSEENLPVDSGRGLFCENKKKKQELTKVCRINTGQWQSVCLNIDR